MKKIIGVFYAILIIFLSGCDVEDVKYDDRYISIEEFISIYINKVNEYTMMYAHELNDNSNMGLELLRKIDRQNDNFDFDYDTGLTKIVSNTYDSFGYYEKFPEESDDYVITEIYIDNPMCHVFGIRPLYCVDSVYDEMESYGYVLEIKKEFSDKEVDLLYRKADVWVCFSVKDNIIQDISVYIEKYNNDSRVILN